MKRTVIALCLLGVTGCQPRSIDTPAAPPPPPPPAPAPVPTQAADDSPRLKPPPPGVTPAAPFPTIHHHELANGLGIRVVERHSLPIVEASLVIESGQDSDDGKTGLAVLAGELLKAGGAGPWSATQLLDHAESLGTRLSVLTDRDATTISLGVTTHHLEEALKILAALAERPRFAPIEYKKLLDREVDRVTSLARTSGKWAASMVLYRELFELPTAKHPYAHYDAMPSDYRALSLADCKRWYKQHVTPHNAFLVVAGDVKPAEVVARAEDAFGKWKGDAPKPLVFAKPLPKRRLQVHVVDRPDSAQSDVLVGTLGPERKSDEWAALRTTNQILGGGVAGRLFLDVREKRSLAYSTGSRVESLAHGPVPIVLSAGTRTPKTGRTVAALLAHLEGVSRKPNQEEVEIASRYLSDSFLIRMETVGNVANLTADLGINDLPDDYYDRYREAVREVSAEDVQQIGRAYFGRKNAVVVVAGDASVIAEPLRRFGPVSIIDPEQGFQVTKKLAHDPSVRLDIEPPSEKQKH